MTGRPGRRAIGDERGSESVETALVLPLLMLVLAFVVCGARVALAWPRIDGVAQAAARQASLARTPGAAQAAADAAAAAALASAGLHCVDIRTAVDPAGFAAPAGQVGAVTVQVWCTVDLSDIAMPGLPGHVTLHDAASSPVDSARTR